MWPTALSVKSYIRMYYPHVFLYIVIFRSVYFNSRVVLGKSDQLLSPCIFREMMIDD